MKFLQFMISSLNLNLRLILAENNSSINAFIIIATKDVNSLAVLVSKPDHVAISVKINSIID